MAGWHLLEKTIDKLGRHSTLTGKYWFLSCLVLRLLMWAVIVNEVFAPAATKSEDKKSLLECDTNAPGCEMLCTNQFYRFNPAWYWAFQILFTCLPVVATMVFFDHKLVQLQDARHIQSTIPLDQKNFFKKRLDALKSKVEDDKVDGIESYSTPYGTRLSVGDIEAWIVKEEKRLRQQEKFDEQISAEQKYAKGQREALEKVAKEYGFLLDKATSRHQSEIPTKLYLAYTAMAFFRCVIEVSFLVAYFYIYPFGLILPEKFYCDQRPCNNVAVCYIEKPIEKSIAMILMVGTSVISICIGLVELFNLVRRSTNTGEWELGAAFTNRHRDLTKLYKPSAVSSIIPTLHQMNTNSFLFENALSSLDQELRPTTFWENNSDLRKRKPDSNSSGY